MKTQRFLVVAFVCTFGTLLDQGAGSAAELSISPAHRAAPLRQVSGYVFWDDVYPPAIYGPYLRPIQEVQALKAAARPVSSRWWAGWYMY